MASDAAHAMEVAAPAREQPLPAAPDDPGPPPDDMAESEFRAEARERGETVAPVAAEPEVDDSADKKALPPLADLVNRIPPEIRETLDDLFRARFTTVKRVPRKALKS